MKKYVYYMLLLIVLGNGVSCSSGYDDSFWEEIMDIPGGNGMGNGNGSVSDDGDIPTFDATISEWNGEMAEDAHLDVVGTDKDFYYELNTFTNRVTITYNGSTATIEQNNDKMLCHTLPLWELLEVWAVVQENFNFIRFFECFSLSLSTLKSRDEG